MTASRPEPARPDPRRLLLIHPGALGDLVQAFPAFAQIRATYPGAHVTLLTADELAQFSAGFALFDRVQAFDTGVAYHGGAAARVALFARLAAALRAGRFDAVGVFKGAPAYAALAALTGAPVRAGLARGWGVHLLSQPLAMVPKVHHEDRYFDVARALGATQALRPPVVWPAADVPGAFAAFAGVERRTAVTAEREVALVAVAPGGARNAKDDYAPKRWPAARFADALLRVARARPLAAVVLGGAGDRGESEALQAALDGRVPVLDLAGATSVAAARAVVASCDAYLGNDSGLMHVAGTTSTPMVVVFGPTDPEVLAPRRAHVRAISHPARSTSCRDEVAGRVRPCAAVCCMDRVDAGEVADALATAIATTLGSHRGDRAVHV